MAWSPGSVLMGVRGPDLAVPTPGLVRGSRHLVVSFEVTTPPESPFEPGGCLCFGFLISLGLLASVGLALGFPPIPRSCCHCLISQTTPTPPPTHTDFPF